MEEGYDFRAFRVDLRRIALMLPEPESGSPAGSIFDRMDSPDRS
jgi:hypothetical protein